MIKAENEDRLVSINHSRYVITGLSLITNTLIGFVILFGVVALGASLLFILGTITADMLRQAKEFGVLQATGWSVRQLQILYATQNILAVLPGIFLGILCGQWAGRWALSQIVAVLGLQVYGGRGWVQSVFVALFGVLLIAVVSWWVMRRIGLVSPAVAINRGFNRPPSRLTQKLQQSRLPFTNQLALSLMFNRPLNSLIAITVLCFGLGAVVFALILNATVREFSSNPATWGYAYDLEVLTAPQYDLTQAERLLANDPDIAKFEPVFMHKVFASDEMRTQLRLVRPEQDLLTLPILTGRKFASIDEVIVGAGLAKSQGIHIGDQLRVPISDNDVMVTVVGTYRSLENMGNMVVGSLELFTKYAPSAAPDYYVVRLNSGVDPTSVQNHLETISDGGLIVLGVADSLTVPFADLFPIILGSLSIGLLVLAGVVMFNMVLIIATEQRYALGVMKALGMGRRGLINVMLSSLIVLLGTALVIGVPSGFGLTLLLINVLSSQVGGVSAIVPYTALTIGIGLSLLPAILGFLLPFTQALRVSPLTTLRIGKD